jgi:hypothetical protein
MIAAGAYVDITQDPKMWMSMAKDAQKDEQGFIESKWWLHTHPLYQSRANHMKHLMNEARKL